MENQLKSIKEEAQKDITGACNIDSLQLLNVKYIGRKGILTNILRNLKEIPPEKRAALGKLANEVKVFIENILEEKSRQLKIKAQEKILSLEKIDITLPGEKIISGQIHPLTQITQEVVNIFTGLGFQTYRGPELETEFYNFEALNIPTDHPSRDMWDSFYIDKDFLLRSHTSPVQIRAMENLAPPLRVISYGRCYRRDAVDATHSWMFHQLEGFMVDENITFADLKGVMAVFAKKLFGEERKVKFIPSYFPFTEPSAEMLIDCFKCAGKSDSGGCSLCKGKGEIEILGAGMIHPQVLRNVKYDAEKYTGFAFGLGLERIAMLKYGIDDIRLFFENDMRFLKQF